MTDTDRTERDLESPKPVSQDAVGLLCCAVGGFFAVSAVQALRGQEPKLASLARPVLGLIEIIGHWPALVFCIGLAGLGCMMFLRAYLIDVWRPLGLAGGAAFGLALFLSGFVPEAGGAFGSALPAALGGIAGKLLSVLIGGLVLLVAFWWGVLSPQANFSKPGNFSGIGRSEDAESTDGVSAAEAAFLVSQPRKASKPKAARQAETPAPSPTLAESEPDEQDPGSSLPFGTRPLTREESESLVEQAASEAASVDAPVSEAHGALAAEPLDVQHDDAGLEPTGSDLAEARESGRQLGDDVTVLPSGEARPLESHDSPLLPSWAAEEGVFDEHGLGEPQPFEPPAEAAASETKAEDDEDFEEAEEEEEELHAEASESETAEPTETPAEEDDDPALAPWEEAAQATTHAPLPARDPVSTGASEAANGAAVAKPLETGDAPDAPGWESDEATVDIKPVAVTGAPPATGVRQESLFEEVDLAAEELAQALAAEKEEAAKAEAQEAEAEVQEVGESESDDEEYEEEGVEEEVEATSAEAENDDEEEWEWEYEDAEEEEPVKGAVASTSTETEDEDEEEYEEEEEDAEAYAEDDSEEGVEEEEYEEEEEQEPALASAEDSAPESDDSGEDLSEPEAVATPEPDVVLQPAAAPDPALTLKSDIDQRVYDSGVLILGQGRVAVSMLQRRFSMDFDQACDVLDRLQELGLIGPYLGGQKREILLTAEEWDECVTASA